MPAQLHPPAWTAAPARSRWWPTPWAALLCSRAAALLPRLKGTTLLMMPAAQTSPSWLRPRQMPATRMHAALAAGMHCMHSKSRVSSMQAGLQYHRIIVVMGSACLLQHATDAG